MIFKYIDFIKIYFLFFCKILIKKNKTTSLIEGIVFSKDRPMQLDLLLQSYFKFVKDKPKLFIIYKFTNNNFLIGYNKVISKYRKEDIVFICESNFKIDLINLLNNSLSKYVFFLVDDIIFIRSFSFGSDNLQKTYSNYIFSPRLDKFKTYQYTSLKNQNIPNYKILDNFMFWNWQVSEGDWSYVFSVDGNVYNRHQINIMASCISYCSPNSFESNMNRFRYILYKKKGICFVENSVLVNLVLNRVQNEIDNTHGLHFVEQLNEKYLNEELIDLNQFLNQNFNSCHIEIENLKFINSNVK